MSWTPVGSVAVGPQDREVLVGSFSLEPDDNCIFVKVTQQNPPDYWTYSFGLLTWKSAAGQELGTIKVYGDVDSEVFRLGTGLTPEERTGDLLFRARAYNRRWIEQALPPIWELDFEAQSGKIFSGGGGNDGLSVPATLGSFANTNNARIPLTVTDGFAYLNFPNQ